MKSDENERLDFLIEECSEVIKAAVKLKRFGDTAEDFDGKLYNNRKDLNDELNDVITVFSIMVSKGEATLESDDQLKERWERKLSRASYQ